MPLKTQNNGRAKRIHFNFKSSIIKKRDLEDRFVSKLCISNYFVLIDYF